MDKLDEIVELQRILMKRLNVATVNDNVDKFVIEKQTKDMLFAICCELGEIGDEINWKPWKKTINPINYVLLRSEIIDVLHFIIEIAIMWGMDGGDIFSEYSIKMKENLARQDRGY